MRVLFAIVFGMLGINCAAADYYDGRGLKRLLNGGTEEEFQLFRGYVAGVQDMNNGVRMCIPPHVRLSEAVSIVQRYISDNPDALGNPGKQIVIDALAEEYPCNRGRRRRD